MDGALTDALYIECTDELPSKLENLYNRGTIERIYYNNPTTRANCSDTGV